MYVHPYAVYRGLPPAHPWHVSGVEMHVAARATLRTPFQVREVRHSSPNSRVLSIGHWPKPRPKLTTMAPPHAATNADLPGLGLRVGPRFWPRYIPDLTSVT